MSATALKTGDIMKGAGIGLATSTGFYITGLVVAAAVLKISLTAIAIFSGYGALFLLAAGIGLIYWGNCKNNQESNPKPATPHPKNNNANIKAKQKVVKALKSASKNPNPLKPERRILRNIVPQKRVLHKPFRPYFFNPSLRSNAIRALKTGGRFLKTYKILISGAAASMAVANGLSALGKAAISSRRTFSAAPAIIAAAQEASALGNAAISNRLTFSELSATIVAAYGANALRKAAISSRLPVSTASAACATSRGFSALRKAAPSTHLPISTASATVAHGASAIGKSTLSRIIPAILTLGGFTLSVAMLIRQLTKNAPLDPNLIPQDLAQARTNAARTALAVNTAQAQLVHANFLQRQVRRFELNLAIQAHNLALARVEELRAQANLHPQQPQALQQLQQQRNPQGPHIGQTPIAGNSYTNSYMNMLHRYLERQQQLQRLQRAAGNIQVLRAQPQVQPQPHLQAQLRPQQHSALIPVQLTNTVPQQLRPFANRINPSSLGFLQDPIAAVRQIRAQRYQQHRGNVA